MSYGKSALAVQVLKYSQHSAMRAGFHASSIERVNQEEEGSSGSDLVEAVYGAVLLCVAAGQAEVVLVGQIAVHVVAVATEHLVRRDCSTQPHSSLVLNTHTLLWKFRRREKERKLRSSPFAKYIRNKGCLRFKKNVSLVGKVLFSDQKAK